MRLKYIVTENKVVVKNFKLFLARRSRSRRKLGYLCKSFCELSLPFSLVNHVNRKQLTKFLNI